jgi:lysophospholipase L1-like esterase
LASILIAVPLLGIAAVSAIDLDIRSMGRSDITISPQAADGNAFFLEQTTDLRSFETISIITNAIHIQPSGKEGFYRLEEIDPEALNYFNRAQKNVSALSSERAVNAWMAGLRTRNLLGSVHYMASFRPGDVSSAQIPAMVGPDAICNKPPKWDGDGMIFDGSFAASLPNFMSPQISELSIFAVCKTTDESLGIIIGNDNAEGFAGPALWAGGNPYIALAPNDLAFTVSSDGRVNAQPGFRYTRTFNWGSTGAPQFILGTASPTDISIQVDMDRSYAATNVDSKPIANPGDQWKIGARINGSLPFHGLIYFIAVFDKKISDEDYTYLRRLYARSIGAGIPFPTTQLVIEGDSLSEEAFETEYAHWLHTSSNWAGKFWKRNVAKYGETTAQMLAEFDSEIPAPELASNYLFIWGGRNDLPASSAEDIFSRLRAYWIRARSEGYKVAAFTIMPATSDAEDPAIVEKRMELNDRIRSASSEYDFLFDVAALPELTNPGDPKYFKADGVHLTADGSKVVANLINNTISP